MTESAVRFQDAGDLIHESREIRITMRSLDIDHDVEAGLRKRELLGVTDLETKPRDLIPSLAMADGLGIEIQADVLGRLISPGEIRRATAMATTDLKHPQATQVDTAADMLIELDVRAVRFVLRLQLQWLHTLFLKRRIQEIDTLLPDPSGKERIPPGPELLTKLRTDEDFFDESH
jgi:hypothetical protein